MGDVAEERERERVKKRADEDLVGLVLKNNVLKKIAIVSL